MNLFKKLLATVAGLALSASSVAAQTQSPEQPMSPLEAEGFRGVLFLGDQPQPAPQPRPTPPPVGLPGPNAGDSYDALLPPQAEEFVFGPNPSTYPWRFWGSAEALLGSTQSVTVVPVVTTGPPTAGIQNAGAVGQPGTVALFGGRHMLGDWRAGVRGEGGVWFDQPKTVGLTGRFYSLFSTSDQLVGVGNGLNVVNVPQFVSLGGLVAQIPAPVGFPGITTGTVSATAQTMFMGGDVNLRRMFRQSSGWRADVLVGYRQLYLHDEIGSAFTVNGTVPGTGTAATAGSSNIRTVNQFYGVNLGGMAMTHWRQWNLEAFGAVSLGVNASDSNYVRSLVVTVPGVPVPPLAANISDPMTYFGTVGEGGLRLGYRLGEHTKLTFGYTALYWANIRRAQEQLTFSQALTGNTSNMLVHMLSWGAEFRY
jgi:hypothetical protein